MNQSKKSLNNWFLILAVFTLAVAPLTFVRGGKFGGSDDKAKAAITEIQPEYKPWFKSLFEPASSEIASLLFSSQAALGAVTQLVYTKDVLNKQDVKNELTNRYFSLH